MPETAVHFITSDDEFIAANRAREIFEELSADVVDDMSKEIVEGSVSKIDEAIKACNDTIVAASTMSLFGGKKVVWLRGVNFISETNQGKGDKVKEALANLADFLKILSAEAAAVVISASPIHRAKPFYKAMQKFALCEDYKADSSGSACLSLIKAQAKKLKVSLESGAAETLSAIVAGNPRMAVQELTKLATYVNFERPISEKDVIEMVPIFGEGDFFDISNAFYSNDIELRLATLRRYFFANKNASARPIISILQKQNSILIQLRAMMEAKSLLKSTSPQPRGMIEDAAVKYADFFADCQDKSNYNVFSQNAWYVGSKLAPIAGKITLKQLLDYQLRFADAFIELIRRPNSDESIMRDLFSQP